MRLIAASRISSFPEWFTIKLCYLRGGESSWLAHLDGNKIAAEIRAEVAAEVTEMTAAGIRPGLAVILVGHNPASEIYVRGKVKSSEEVGIYSARTAYEK